MIQAQIELFLKAQGRLQFTNWFGELARVLSGLPGFINAQLMEVEGALTPRVVLIFNSRDDLQHALESAQFAQMMHQMQPHLLQQYHVHYCKAVNFIKYRHAIDDPACQWPQVERRRASQTCPE